MISMQLFWFQHCYFALCSYHESKQNGDVKGIIFNRGYLYIYLSFYMYKLIIWVDGYVSSLSGGVPSCPCVLRKKKKKVLYVTVFRMRFLGGERLNVSFCLMGSENSAV